MKTRTKPTGKSRRPRLSRHHTAATGCVAEHYLCALLLEAGFSVSKPLVDVAVDCVAFNAEGRALKIQAKRRTKIDGYPFEVFLPKDEASGMPTHLFCMRGPLERPEHWLVPFELVRRLARRIQDRRGRTGYRFYLNENVRRAVRDYLGEDGIYQARTWRR